MKKWFAFAAVFFSSYLVFLVATMPLTLLMNNINLPKNMIIGNVSGSIWQGEISEISMNDNKIEAVQTSLGFWSLVLFSPSVDVSFGDAMLDGPEGKLSLTVSSEQIVLNDVELFISANELVKHLTLPVPVKAQGNVEITLTELSVKTSAKLTCENGQGKVSWLRSGVIALDNTIKLGTFNADIECEKGDIIAKISPKNNLGLSLNTRLSLAKQRPSGQGYLKPGAKFPATLRPALSFLGSPDNQGRYPIKF